MADMILAIAFTVIAAVALFANEDKIAAWQEEISKRQKHKSARPFGRSLAAQASEITFGPEGEKNGRDCDDSVKIIVS